MLESRDGSENVVTQTVYGTQYVDEIVRWWRDGRGAMYVLQDANWNVTSTVDYDGKVLDRVRLTPYGIATFDTETINGDYDGDGDTDSSDSTELSNCYGTATGACRIFDYDDNGTINLADLFDFLALSPTDSDVQRQPVRRTSPNRFPFAHQGLVLDQETLSYQNRHRQLLATLRRYLQRDPQAFLNAAFLAKSNYPDGLAPQAAFGMNPVSFADPEGLQKCIIHVLPEENSYCVCATGAPSFWDRKNKCTAGDYLSAGHALRAALKKSGCTKGTCEGKCSGNISCDEPTDEREDDSSCPGKAKCCRTEHGCRMVNCECC